MRFRRTLLAVFLVVAPRIAHAEPSREDVARADQLFREAQQLSQRGQHAEACPKLAESQALDPANGTLLNLAICHENEGKTATAQRELQTLLGQLSTSRDDRARARLANERLKGLEKKLARITFDTSALPPGARITLDGANVDEPSAATPIDPGSHAVVVSAKQKKRGTQTIEIREAGVTRSVKLDPLEDEAPVVVAPPPPAPEEPPPPPPAPPSGGQRTAGLVVAGVGLVGLGLGVGFGLRTLSLKSDRDQRCNATTCDAEGLRLHDSAKTSATISTVGILVGAAALVGGAVLYLTAPHKAAKPSGEARIYVTPDGLGFRGL